LFIKTEGWEGAEMNKMKRKYLSVLASAGLVILLLLAQTNTALAATAPSLGAAESFGVLGASTVTNVPAAGTVVNGDLGLWPGTAITGFGVGQGVVVGTIHTTDAVAQHAQTDALTAYNNLAGQGVDHNYSGTDLGGLTLLPGVYKFDTSAQLTGKLTLNALGDPDSVFIFQIGSTLTTASGSSVEVINEPPNWCNKFWQVGSSATLGTGTAFQGNILAHDSITLNTDATVYGRALALNAAVTMDDNRVTVPVCATAPIPTPTLSGWGLVLLVGLLVAVGFFALRKSARLRLG
jgi:hypothetical protein